MKLKTRVSTTAPWFVPTGQVLSVKRELEGALRSLDGKSPREIFAFQDGAVHNLQWAGQPEEEQPTSTAIVPLIGPITQYRGVCDWMFGGTSLEAFMDAMETAYADESISSIVMVIDSPGGEAAGNADAADRIREISQTKPVIAWVPGDGCSAAYFLAAAASKIIASQTAILGSIGTVIAYVDETEADKMAGRRNLEFVSSVSPNKRQDPTTDAGKAYYQGIVDEFGEIFVNSVARLRGVTPEKVISDFGKGGVVIGAKAVAAGLADMVGTYSDAIAEAQSLAIASLSSPGTSPLSTARAQAGQGGLMSKTAAELKAEHPEAAQAISLEAAQAERSRIAAILKLNTAANRSVAAEAIDAAIVDGKTQAGDLALAILDANDQKLKAVAKARMEDPVEVDEPAEPPVDKDPSKPASIDTSAVYARMNGAK